MEFTYRLTGTGWAEARVANGAVAATITASYLEDALGELLEAIGVLLEGGNEARCSWEEEPGEYRWIFDREGSDLRLRVLAFADIYSREPDDSGTLVFETTAPLREVATAIAQGAQEVLDEHGEDEYQRRLGGSSVPDRPSGTDPGSARHSLKHTHRHEPIPQVGVLTIGRVPGYALSPHDLVGEVLVGRATGSIAPVIMTS